MTITAQAPAKIILFGEHAVVYGQPAIAIPFGALKATARVIPAPPGAGLALIARDVGRALHVHPEDESPDNALTFAASLALKALAIPAPDLTIEVKSSIPIGGGFGSGAAVSAALIRAIGLAVERPFEDAALNDLVFEVEKMHHGTPSGIDNTTIVYNMPVWFVKGNSPEPFKVGMALALVVAYSGIPASTRETVGDVRALYDADHAKYGSLIERIGALVRAARGHIEAGDLRAVGAQMYENHALLRWLTVSSPALDRLVEAAREAGALGAKLSGGGRGGNVIALVDLESAEPVSRALSAAGAQRLWHVNLE